MALSETNHLFWLFRFYTKTESFNVSIEPKQTKDQPKQFDWKHILAFFKRLFRFVSKQFCLFRLFRYRFESPKQTEKKKFFVFGLTKQTETQPKQILFRSVSVRTEIFFIFFEDTLLPTSSRTCNVLPEVLNPTENGE